MNKILFIILFLLGFAGAVSAFEIDGFKRNMSIQEAQAKIKRSFYDKVEVKENYIMAHDNDSNRFIGLSFCDGKLIQVEKHLQPRFDYFTRLVDEKRNELGKPFDAWSNPTDVTSNIETNSVTFLWKVEDIIIQVIYYEYPTNKQLSILYQTYNKCWKIPY